jgi:hypothetical protein
MDATTGAVKRQLGSAGSPLNDPLRAWAGADRTIYAGHAENDVRRYDANGDPVPFNGPCRRFVTTSPTKFDFTLMKSVCRRTRPVIPSPAVAI